MICSAHVLMHASCGGLTVHDEGRLLYINTTVYIQQQWRMKNKQTARLASLLHGRGRPPSWQLSFDYNHNYRSSIYVCIATQPCNKLAREHASLYFICWMLAVNSCRNNVLVKQAYAATIHKSICT
jgi:hypothetical protein